MNEDSQDAEIECLKINVRALEERVRILEDSVEVIWTPWWKRIWFVLDGYPWYRLQDKPTHRFWHRWTRS